MSFVQFCLYTMLAFATLAVVVLTVCVMYAMVKGFMSRDS